MLRALEAAHVRRWAVACVQALDAHREAIDRINVYPVADSDTGSNLLHTMRAALDALLRAPAPTRTDAAAALAALARGALEGARGNSGVLISQMLRGAADALMSPDTPAPSPTPATDTPPTNPAPAATHGSPAAAPAAPSGTPTGGAMSPGTTTPTGSGSPGTHGSESTGSAGGGAPADGGPAATDSGTVTGSAAPGGASAGGDMTPGIAASPGSASPVADGGAAAGSPGDGSPADAGPAATAGGAAGDSAVPSDTSTGGDMSPGPAASSGSGSPVAESGAAAGSAATDGSGAAGPAASGGAQIGGDMSPGAAAQSGSGSATNDGGASADSADDGSLAGRDPVVAGGGASAGPAAHVAAPAGGDSPPGPAALGGSTGPAGSTAADSGSAGTDRSVAAGSPGASSRADGGSAGANGSAAAASTAHTGGDRSPGAAGPSGFGSVAAGSRSSLGLAVVGRVEVAGAVATADVGVGRVVTGDGLRAALLRGAQRAAVALSDPMPGTMISVLAAAAEAAAAEAGELGDVAAAAAAGAAAALDETPRQLAVLAEAGVVDAGGRGVVVVLDALLAVVSEQPAALAAAQRARTERVTAPAEHSMMYTARESGSDAFAYEVMYLLENVPGDGDPIGRLRDRLVGLGDCVSVVGDGAGLWTVHVHCNDIGAAIEVGVETGRPRQIRVARFADAPSAEASRFVKDRAVVVPARSTELGDLLISEGVTVVPVEDDPAADPETAYRLLEAVTGTAAAHVTVLPADSTLIEISDEAAIRAVAAGQDVVVVPCASPVQVLAAVAVHDPRRRAGDDVVAMAEAAAATRRGEVVVSAEAAITWIGACEAGDVLGLADGEVVLIEPGPPGVDALDRAACGVVERMLGMGGELVTALLGAAAPDELADELTDYLRREHPETELVVYHGGQTDAVLILGVE